MKKIVLAIVATTVVASPAFAQKKHHVQPTQGLYLQQQTAPSWGAAAPSSPAVMVKGKPNTDPDPFIYNYLKRSYNEEGLG
jgi:hypothetical protein